MLMWVPNALTVSAVPHGEEQPINFVLNATLWVIDKSYPTKHLQELYENQVSVFSNAFELVDDGHHREQKHLLLGLIGKPEFGDER